MATQINERSVIKGFIDRVREKNGIRVDVLFKLGCDGFSMIDYFAPNYLTEQKSYRLFLFWIEVLKEACGRQRFHVPYDGRIRTDGSVIVAEEFFHRAWKFMNDWQVLATWAEAQKQPPSSP